MTFIIYVLILCIYVHAHIYIYILCISIIEYKKQIIYIYIYYHTIIHACACTYICIYIHTYIYIYTYISIRIHEAATRTNPHGRLWGDPTQITGSGEGWDLAITRNNMGIRWIFTPRWTQISPQNIMNTIWMSYCLTISPIVDIARNN